MSNNKKRNQHAQDVRSMRAAAAKELAEARLALRQAQRAGDKEAIEAAQDRYIAARDALDTLEAKCYG